MKIISLLSPFLFFSFCLMCADGEEIFNELFVVDNLLVLQKVGQYLVHPFEQKEDPALNRELGQQIVVNMFDQGCINAVNAVYGGKRKVLTEGMYRKIAQEWLLAYQGAYRDTVPLVMKKMVALAEKAVQGPALLPQDITRKSGEKS